MRECVLYTANTHMVLRVYKVLALTQCHLILRTIPGGGYHEFHSLYFTNREVQAQDCPRSLTVKGRHMVWTQSSVHGILQARTLEWVAFPFPRGSSQPRDWTRLSCVAGRFFTSWATRWLSHTPFSFKYPAESQAPFVEKKIIIMYGCH